MIGQTISHYKILEKLGGGGMGVVYKAHDTRLKRTVALKFLPPDLTRDEDAKTRFVHEAQAASALQHPNICTIHDVDETIDNRLFIVMDCYEGESLKEKIAGGPLPIDKAVDIATQVAQGLAKAHESGIVHRDIKPANIMVGKDGIVRIVDFGLAKLSGQTMLTKSGRMVGTAAYMSPEQARGDKVDHRTDIWSLGVVLYEMLTEHQPFASDYEQAMMYAIMSGEPKPIEELRPEVPGSIIGIVQRAMEKDKEKRFQTATEIAEALRGEGKPQKKRMSRKKKRMAFALAGSVVIVASAIIMFFSIGRGEVFDSIAVLPAENLSGDENQQAFTDGMTTALIDELQKVGSLTTISWQSVKRYKKTDKSIVEIARELGVKAVVSMQYLREKDNVRISVSLIPASSPKPIWSKTLDREIKGVLALHSDVAQSIVHEIRVVVTPQEKEKLVATRKKVVPEAYELYLKGRFFWNKRIPKELEKAIGYFRRAIEIDTSLAEAYSGVSDCYVLLGGYAGMSSHEAALIAKDAAMRALVIDSTLAEAHTSLAFVLERREWSWHNAEAHYQRAIENNPKYATAHQWYGLFLVHRGRSDLGLAELRQALSLDPLSFMINADMGLAYNWARKFDDGIIQLRKTLALDSTYILTHQFLSSNYEALGMKDEAIRERLKMLESSRYEPQKLDALRKAFHTSGWRGYWREELQQKLHGIGRIEPRQIATIFVRLDDPENALLWLEKAFEEKDSGLENLACSFIWDGFRTNPRFIAIQKKVDRGG